MCTHLPDLNLHTPRASVNNAGIQFVAPVAEFPEDKWDDILAVCLSSAFHASKAALPFMQASIVSRTRVSSFPMHFRLSASTMND
jgi:NAD(P)-dependent dehydrogenase (short-subunit alcohol dehydrogenase family)